MLRIVGEERLNSKHKIGKGFTFMEPNNLAGYRR